MTNFREFKDEDFVSNCCGTSIIEEWKPTIGDRCFYSSSYQNTCNIFKTKILAKSKKPDCFDIQSARPLNDYSGRYLIVPNVHKSNLFKLEDLLIQIKQWAWFKRIFFHAQKEFLQEPKPLKIGYGIKLRNPRGFSIEPADTKIYEVIEFLDKGDFRIREIFSKKERIINGGQIGEVIDD